MLAVSFFRQQPCAALRPKAAKAERLLEGCKMQTPEGLEGRPGGGGEKAAKCGAGG